MAISFSCPVCAHAISVADDLTGKLAKCPHCQGALRVPRAGEASIKKAGVNQRTSALGTAIQNPPVEEESPVRSAPRQAPSDKSFFDTFNSCVAYLLVAAVIGIGAIMVLYYWLAFDTTTGASGSRVHNQGLMNDRLVGVLVSIGLVALGVVLAKAVRRAAERRF